MAGLFGEEDANNEGTNSHIAAMQDGADELDGDFDSDAKDYDFEDDIDSDVQRGCPTLRSTRNVLQTSVRALERRYRRVGCAPG